MKIKYQILVYVVILCLTTLFFGFMFNNIKEIKYSIKVIENYNEKDRSLIMEQCYWIPGQGNKILFIYDEVIKHKGKKVAILFYDVDFNQWVKIGEEDDNILFNIIPYSVDEDKIVILRDYSPYNYEQKFGETSHVKRDEIKFIPVIYSGKWKTRVEKEAVYQDNQLRTRSEWPGMKEPQIFIRFIFGGGFFKRGTKKQIMERKISVNSKNYYIIKTDENIYKFKKYGERDCRVGLWGINDDGTMGLFISDCGSRMAGLMVFEDLIK